MKTLKTITFLLFLICFGSFSQGYESVFGKESTTWWIMNYFTIASTSKYNFIEEKVINDKTYKYANFLYLRESDDNSKLYIIPEDWNEEMLLMDLTLEEGDTFKIEGQNIDSDIAIVDTVYYDNEKKVLELNYFLPCWWDYKCPEDYSELKVEFREGIGTNLFDIQNYYGQSGFLLTCIEKDGAKTYMSYVVKEYQWMNTGEDSCDFEAGGDFIQNQDEPSAHVQPNPISDKGELIFNNPDSKEFVMELYTISGILYSKSKTMKDRFILSYSELTEGMSFYKLYNTRKNVCTGKIIFAKK